MITREVRACLDHLRPWMPFAGPEPDEALYARWFTEFWDDFERGNYTFSVWTHDGDFVGGCGLHPTVSKLGREAGYWVVERSLGRGYAGEILGGLCHLAFEHLSGVDRVELRIEPENAASIRVAQKAGFEREALLKRRLDFGGTLRDIEVWSLFAHQWPKSPNRSLPVRFLDAQRHEIQE